MLHAHLTDCLSQGLTTVGYWFLTEICRLWTSNINLLLASAWPLFQYTTVWMILYRQRRSMFNSSWYTTATVSWLGLSCTLNTQNVIQNNGVCLGNIERKKHLVRWRLYGVVSGRSFKRPPVFSPCQTPANQYRPSTVSQLQTEPTSPQLFACMTKDVVTCTTRYQFATAVVSCNCSL